MPYGVTALVLGAIMVAFAWHVRAEPSGERGARAAKAMFAYSIVYLFVLFAVLLVEDGGLIGWAA